MVFDDGLRVLIQDMAETMYVSQGIGLAAPQIAALVRIFIVDLEDGRALKVFVNPEIKSSSGSQVNPEGCLSLPGVVVNRKRAAKILVQAQDEYGKTFLLEAEGLLAIAIQHENDHLNGELLIDTPKKKSGVSRRT